MEIDTNDPIVSCEELITAVDCAEDIPKTVHIIAYKSIDDLRCDFKDKETTRKTILSLPQLAPAREIVENLIMDNERLANICLDNATQIESLRESIIQVDRHSEKLYNKIAQLQKDLSSENFDEYYNKYVNGVESQLESIKNDVLGKKIQFDEYFKVYDILKSELLGQQILKQIYSK